MPAPPPLVKAVEAAIVASAHLAAYENLAAAAQAVRRLGALSSGRWRAAARDLERLAEELQTAFSDVANEVSTHANKLGIEDEALWAAGDAAGTLALVRDTALEELDDGSPAASLLDGEAIFGVSFVEDPDAPDRGTTLVFGWAEPLAPATWPWEASWISSSSPSPGGGAEPIEQLDLYETGDLEVGEPMLEALADRLRTDRDQALEALRAAAEAATRASLLLAAGRVPGLEGDQDGAARG